MSKSSNTEFLRDLMGQYTTENLREITPEEFRTQIDKFLALNDHEMEGYDSPDGQRHESVKFHWGHNHDFGDFQLEGKAGDRHITVVSKFLELGLPRNLEGKRVLDVGAWTGGTSLLLTAMGADVQAIEEVNKYASVIEFLARSFHLRLWALMPMSIYDLRSWDGTYDYVILAGVLYHLTDPVLALRILFNCLEDGGRVFIESAVAPAEYGGAHTLTYHGPSKGTWNWFVPSSKAVEQMLIDVGFEEVKFFGEGNRAYFTATRKQYKDMLRAGLSRRDIR
jgi:2-polyprenyl-3-methyl-5-hydroxy-6-metoxy-1,4-benzoquinol methylase